MYNVDVYYSLKFFLLACFFPVTYQPLRPTRLKKKKMERKGKEFGHGFADLT